MSTWVAPPTQETPLNMKIEYKPWAPSDASWDLVVEANEIIKEYLEQDYTLTLRQLYYQMVARDIIPNTERSYKNLGTVITKARLAGMVSWTAIEDRAREYNDFWTEEDPLVPIHDLPLMISFDYWERQPYYLEVWVEKEALGNVIERACNPFRVPHMSCKGYMSSSESWRAGRRFLDRMQAGKKCVLIHLGDHDPSGIDMTRDNKDRMDLFTFANLSRNVEVRRIALNMDQIQQYTPPPNPAKVTDSRAKDYIERFGRTSWELDALEPSVTENLITSTIREYVDWSAWGDVRLEEEEVKKKLRRVEERWDDIQQIIGDDT